MSGLDPVVVSAQTRFRSLSQGCSRSTLGHGHGVDPLFGARVGLRELSERAGEVAEDIIGLRAGLQEVANPDEGDAKVIDRGRVPLRFTVGDTDHEVTKLEVIDGVEKAKQVYLTFKPCEYGSSTNILKEDIGAIEEALADFIGLIATDRVALRVDNGMSLEDAIEEVKAELADIKEWGFEEGSDGLMRFMFITRADLSSATHPQMGADWRGHPNVRTYPIGPTNSPRNNAYERYTTALHTALTRFGKSEYDKRPKRSGDDEIGHGATSRANYGNTTNPEMAEQIRNAQARERAREARERRGQEEVVGPNIGDSIHDRSRREETLREQSAHRTHGQRDVSRSL